MECFSDKAKYVAMSSSTDINNIQISPLMDRHSGRALIHLLKKIDHAS